MEALSKELQKILLLVLLFPILAFFGLITRIQEFVGVEKTANDYIDSIVKKYRQ
jgi:ABC-type cobalt transport system substrate-binding protein